ncbi:mycofactocin system GMC family oxidoreductase MftG [Nocardia lijiangensis]|uniref:mycofactocin dehydrogenase MftG n=1 Tax=Nocardia lijiangensis TaxID=299618 RepID=UPI0008299DA2|nr:mycofactocin system GMC family oxidoreductase MftG [Nocardia lijiangensis]
MVDTLIVGGGTAGCVLAARLSERPDHTVRLLEAGQVWSAAAEMPAALRDATRLPIGPEARWLWRYPATLAASSDEHPAVEGNLVRGKGIGGSSTVNGSYFVRAPAADFAAWSAALGGTADWSFEAVLPAYRRLEDDRDYGDGPGHGRGGPIPVRRTADPTPVSRAFAAAARAADFAEVPDLNAPQGAGPAEGVGPVPCNVDGGARVGTASAYLLPALGRPNLTVQGGVLVSRIRFRGTRAIGIDYRRGETSGTISADRIVLCAGAVESAALLLRSGVGPPDELAALGIPVVWPAPVGARFDDHPEIGLEYLLDIPTPAAVPLEYVLSLDDIEIRPYTVPFAWDRHRLGVALMRPESAGVLQLRGADPLTPPRIEHRYLAGAADRGRLRDAVALAIEVLHRIPGAYPCHPPPASGHDAWLRANLATSQHLSGTCRMGAAEDERAVVDARCAVHGVSGLSVVDLSVVPVPLSRGPQATTVMLAERAAGWLTS